VGRISAGKQNYGALLFVVDHSVGPLRMSARLLVRSPGRMSGKEAVYEADSVSYKQTKNQANHARCRNQSLV